MKRAKEQPKMAQKVPNMAPKSLHVGPKIQPKSGQDPSQDPPRASRPHKTLPRPRQDIPRPSKTKIPQNPKTPKPQNPTICGLRSIIKNKRECPGSSLPSWKLPRGRRGRTTVLAQATPSIRSSSALRSRCAHTAMGGVTPATTAQRTPKLHICEAASGSRTSSSKSSASSCETRVACQM